MFLAFAGQNVDDSEWKLICPSLLHETRQIRSILYTGCMTTTTAIWVFLHVPSKWCIYAFVQE